MCLLVVLACSGPQKESVLQVSSGSLERLENFESEYVPPRNIDIWLPEGYSKRKKYAVLYMHDGGSLYDSTTTWNKQEWQVDENLGSLIKEKKVPPTIVVGIWNGGVNRHSEYFPQKPFESLDKDLQDSIYANSFRFEDQELFSQKIYADNYLKFLVNELKPYIDKNYSTKPDREHTYVAGSSMGGLISMYAICEYPEVFQSAACLSTHWVGTFTLDNNPIPDAFGHYLKGHLPNLEDHKLYFDYGTKTLDSLYEPLQMKMDSLVFSLGYPGANYKSLKFEGADHSERAWSERLHIPLEFILNPIEPKTPEDEIIQIDSPFPTGD